MDAIRAAMAPHGPSGAVAQLTSLMAFPRPTALPGRPAAPPSTPAHTLLACALSALALSAPPPAAASIPLASPPPQEQQRRALGQMGVAVRRPTPTRAQPEEEPVSVQIERVAALTAAADAAAAAGDYPEALRCESEVVQRYGDLALAERARVRRALLLYQVGRTDDALLQLEDEEVALRGNAEVHAALAVVLYDRGRATAAESQWDVATEFDRRFADTAWVAAERRWPPALLDALQRFLTLS